MTNQELQHELLMEYPGASINNARSIIRNDIERLKVGGKWSILQAKYGFDCDYQSSDAGEPPKGALEE